LRLALSGTSCPVPPPIAIALPGEALFPEVAADPGCDVVGRAGAGGARQFAPCSSSAIVGMLRTANRSARRGSASTLTLTSRTAGSRTPAARSKAGAMA